ncbi:CoxG family protein [Embleya sp. AB8]|uniref:CoxG family protein n=1 Tax=Embleya sp. AB8 TaxID=3156304 RepID=UPI003C74BE58
MQYEVVVPIPVRAIWETFHDAERLGQCVPGLLLDRPARDGAGGVELIGRWRLRVGADTVAYRGTLRLVDAAEPLALTATVEGAEEGGAGRLDAEFTMRLYDLSAADDGESDRGGETRIVFTAEPGPKVEADADADADAEAAAGTDAETEAETDSARRVAFGRAADLFAAALADELAPPPDTPFEPVEPIAEPFAGPRTRVRPAPPVSVLSAEPDLWSEAGRGTGRVARRALGVLVPVLGALVVWRLAHVRRRNTART